MPTYDYVCRACGHTFEAFQSITEGPKRKCPSCGQSKLQRLIGAGAGIVFKGSGFYQTDYRSKSYSEGAKAEKPAETDKGPEKEPETKPAKGSDTAKPAGSDSSAAGKSKKKGTESS